MIQVFSKPLNNPIYSESCFHTWFLFIKNDNRERASEIQTQAQQKRHPKTTSSGSIEIHSDLILQTLDFNIQAGSV